MTERILNLIELGYDIEEATEIVKQEESKMNDYLDSEEDLIDNLVNKGWTQEESERIILGFNR